MFEIEKIVVTLELDDRSFRASLDSILRATENAFSKLNSFSPTFNTRSMQSQIDLVRSDLFRAPLQKTLNKDIDIYKSSIAKLRSVNSNSAYNANFIKNSATTAFPTNYNSTFQRKDDPCEEFNLAFGEKTDKGNQIAASAKNQAQEIGSSTKRSLDKHTQKLGNVETAIAKSGRNSALLVLFEKQFQSLGQIFSKAFVGSTKRSVGLDLFANLLGGGVSKAGNKISDIVNNYINEFSQGLSPSLLKSNLKSFLAKNKETLKDVIGAKSTKQVIEFANKLPSNNAAIEATIKQLIEKVSDPEEKAQLEKLYNTFKSIPDHLNKGREALNPKIEQFKSIEKDRQKAVKKEEIPLVTKQYTANLQEKAQQKTQAYDNKQLEQKAKNVQETLLKKIQNLEDSIVADYKVQEALIKKMQAEKAKTAKAVEKSIVMSPDTVTSETTVAEPDIDTNINASQDFALEIDGLDTLEKIQEDGLEIDETSLKELENLKNTFEPLEKSKVLKDFKGTVAELKNLQNVDFWHLEDLSNIDLGLGDVDELKASDDGLWHLEDYKASNNIKETLKEFKDVEIGLADDFDDLKNIDLDLLGLSDLEDLNDIDLTVNLKSNDLGNFGDLDNLDTEIPTTPKKATTEELYKYQKQKIEAQRKELEELYVSLNNAKEHGIYTDQIVQKDKDYLLALQVALKAFTEGLDFEDTKQVSKDIKDAQKLIRRYQTIGKTDENITPLRAGRQDALFEGSSLLAEDLTTAYRSFIPQESLAVLDKGSVPGEKNYGEYIAESVKAFKAILAALKASQDIKSVAAYQKLVEDPEGTETNKLEATIADLEKQVAYSEKTREQTKAQLNKPLERIEALNKALDQAKADILDLNFDSLPIALRELIVESFDDLSALKDYTPPNLLRDPLLEEESLPQANREGNYIALPTEAYKAIQKATSIQDLPKELITALIREIRFLSGLQTGDRSTDLLNQLFNKTKNLDEFSFKNLSDKDKETVSSYPASQRKAAIDTLSKAKQVTTRQEVQGLIEAPFDRQAVIDEYLKLYESIDTILIKNINQLGEALATSEGFDPSEFNFTELTTETVKELKDKIKKGLLSLDRVLAEGDDVDLSTAKIFNQTISGSLNETIKKIILLTQAEAKKDLIGKVSTRKTERDSKIDDESIDPDTELLDASVALVTSKHEEITAIVKTVEEVGHLQRASKALVAVFDTLASKGLNLVLSERNSITSVGNFGWNQAGEIATKALAGSAQLMLGGTKNTILTTKAIAGYASAFEDATLALIPFGTTIKAATQLVGGTLLLEGMSGGMLGGAAHTSQALLSPGVDFLANTAKAGVGGFLGEGVGLAVAGAGTAAAGVAPLAIGVNIAKKAIGKIGDLAVSVIENVDEKLDGALSSTVDQSARELGQKNVKQIKVIGNKTQSRVQKINELVKSAQQESVLNPNLSKKYLLEAAKEADSQIEIAKNTTVSEGKTNKLQTFIASLGKTKKQIDGLLKEVDSKLKDVQVAATGIHDALTIVISDADVGDYKATASGIDKSIAIIKAQNEKVKTAIKNKDTDSGELNKDLLLAIEQSKSILATAIGQLTNEDRAALKGRITTFNKTLAQIKTSAEKRKIATPTEGYQAAATNTPIAIDIPIQLPNLKAKGKETATDLIKGLEIGIQSNQDSLQAIVVDLAEELPNTIKRINEIQSPSRRWKKLGIFMIQGLEQGLKVNSKLLTDIKTKLQDEIKDLEDDLDTNVDLDFDLESETNSYTTTLQDHLKNIEDTINRYRDYLTKPIDIKLPTLDPDSNISTAVTKLHGSVVEYINLLNSLDNRVARQERKAARQNLSDLQGSEEELKTAKNKAYNVADGATLNKSKKLFIDTIDKIEDRFVAFVKTLNKPQKPLEGVQNELEKLFTVVGSFTGRIIKTPLSYLASFSVLKLAFKGIRELTQEAMINLTNFFSFSQGLSAFKDVQVLELQFKSINLTLKDAINTANKLGVSLNAVKGQSGIVKSLQTSFDPTQAQNISADLQSGLVQNGVIGEPLERAMEAISQIAGKGTVSLEELRGQLSDHLPGAMQIAARSMGMTEKALINLIKSGQLTSTEFLPAFAAELKKSTASINTDYQEFIRTQNALIALQAQMFKNLLAVTKPLMQVFNFFANDARQANFAITALGTTFTLLAGRSVLLSTSILANGLALTKLGSLFGAFFSAVVADAILASAAFAAVGISIAALTSIATFKSPLRDQVDDLTKAIKEFKKEVDDPALKNIEIIPQTDLANRFSNWATGGLIEQNQKEAINISFSDAFTQLNDSTSKLITSDTLLNEKVKEGIALQEQLGLKKLEYQKAVLAGADISVLSELNKDITKISESFKNVTVDANTFFTTLEFVEKLMKTDAFKLASEDTQQTYQNLYRDLQKLKPLYTKMQDDLKRQSRFAVKIDIAKGELEGLQADAIKIKAEIDLKSAQKELETLQLSKTAAIDVSIRIDNNALSQTKASLSVLSSEIATLESKDIQIKATLEDLDNPAIESFLSASLGGTKLTEATMAQLQKAKAEIAASNSEDNSLAAKALQYAIDRKQIETDLLGKRKELIEKQKEQLQLELKILAATRNRSASKAQFGAARETDAANRESLTGQIETAKMRLAGQLTEVSATFRNSVIELNKSKSLMSASNSRFNALAKQLITGTDKATKDWFLNIIGQPGANLAEAINTVGSELLAEVRKGFGDEISANPVREQFFSRVEQASGLKDQSLQQELDYTNQKSQLIEQKDTEIDSARDAVKSAYQALQDAFRAVEDFNLNLRRTIEDLNIQLKRNKIELERTKSNNRAIVGDYIPGLSAVSKFIKLIEDNRFAEQENNLSIEEQQLQISRAQEDRLKEIANLAKTIADAQGELVKATADLTKLLAEKDAISKEMQGMVETKLTTTNTHLANIESNIKQALQTNSSSGATATVDSTSTNNPTNNSLGTVNKQITEVFKTLSSVITDQKTKTTNLNKEITQDRKSGGIWTKAGNVIDLGDGGQTQKAKLAPIESKEATLRKENKVLLEQEKLYQKVGNVAIGNAISLKDLQSEATNSLDEIIKTAEEKNTLDKAGIDALQESSKLRLTDTKLISEAYNLSNQVYQKEMENLGVRKEINTEIAKGNRLKESFEARLTRIQVEEELASVGDKRRELETNFNNLRSEYGMPGVGYEQTISSAGDKAKSEITKAVKEGEKEILNLKLEQVYAQDKINELNATIPKLEGETRAEAERILEVMREKLSILPEETAQLEQNLELMKAQTAEIEAAARAKKQREIEQFEASTNVDLATQAVDAAAKNPYAFAFGEEAEIRKVIEVHRIEVENQQALDSVLEKAIQLGASGGAIDAIKSRFEELKQIKLDSVNQQFDEIGNTLAESLGSNLQSALTGIFNGTKSVGEALRDFAIGILNDIASMAAKILTQNIMNGLFGGGQGQQAGGFVSSIFGGGGGGGGLLDGALSIFGGGDIFGGAADLGIGGFGDIIGGGLSLFNQGGMIKNYAEGGAIGSYEKGGKALPNQKYLYEQAMLGAEVLKAMRKEGANAIPIVANTNEWVLSNKTGDAQLYQNLKQSGTWDRVKQKGIDNFALGGRIGGSLSMQNNASQRQQSQSVPSRNTTINMQINTKDANSFRKTKLQTERDMLLALERSKLRSGKR